MKHFSLLLSLFLLLTSCIREEEYDNSATGNFEALWTLIDEHYCYLDYKGIAELKDGHVNLYSAWNTARYWDWYLDYPRNFSEALIEDYLGRDYRIGGGARYTILKDNIGYVYYPDFSAGIGDGNLDEMLLYLGVCNGLIIDVRGNGGGNLTTSSKLAARFTNERVHVGYLQHKTGPGHSDFSDPEPLYIDPSDGVRWQKPVVVLTNRHSYSATNDFVNSMRCFPQVTLVGDRTGGGGGMPFSSELPNGWGVRFSASPTLDADGQHIEDGIDPDIHVDMTEEDEARGVDTIIEAAREALKNRG